VDAFGKPKRSVINPPPIGPIISETDHERFIRIDVESPFSAMLISLSNSIRDIQ